MAHIVFDNVRFAYGRVEVVSGLDLDIADGEAHALLGASGAGKTTLLNLMSGLAQPASGRILFDGRDVSRLPPPARNIAQVFQFPVLYDGLSVAGNLEFPLRNRGVANSAARVREVAGFLGLGELLDSRPAALSAFDRQKVAMGRALVRTDVAAVLLDEPLTAVEPAAKWQLRRILKDTQAQFGVTMVYVTHDQLEALTFASRVSVMADGAVLQCGTPMELFAQPAHRFVGHFIGSPGMNLLPARSLAFPDQDGVVADAAEIGFRPEHGTISHSAAADALPVTLTQLALHGTRDGQPWGLATANRAGIDISTRQLLTGLVPGPAWLQVAPAHRHVFVDGWRVAAGGSNDVVQVRRA